ncbi:MAG: hypothetical protein JWP91_4267 [Fibrobacteres bacterium]|nr:hypothetical protein [Fibrobacterota bacterium]
MGLLILSFILALLTGLTGCSRDFNSPYLAEPQDNTSPWAIDSDHDGVADSVEKYAPGCTSEADICLALAQQAQALGKPAGDVLVTSISAPDMTLAVGETKSAQVQLLPANATSKNYELSSKNGNVAVVRPGGIYAAGEGTSTVTVHALDGSDKTAQFKVTVVAAVKKISAKNLTLKLGSGAVAPDVAFAPPEAAATASAGFFLTGGEPAIAVVTADRRHVEARGPGTTTFLVLLNDNPVAGAFDVKVEAPAKRVESAQAEPMSFTLLNLLESGRKRPVVHWTPSDAADKEYALASSNARVAKIVGDQVEAGVPGQAYVTLVTHDGGFKSYFSVTVSLLAVCDKDDCEEEKDNKGKGG